MLEGRNAAKRPWFIGGEQELYIVVQLPGDKDPARTQATIGATAQMDFKLVSDRYKVTYYVDANGNTTRYITGYIRTGMWTGQAGLNWSILVRQPEHVALGDILVLEKQMLLVAALGCMFLMAGGVLVAYKVTAPMNALTSSLEANAADGNAADTDDDYVPVGWSYYEFNRLSKAVGNLAKHSFDSPATDLEPRVNARVEQLRELITGLPPSDPHRDRSLFKITPSE